jgi:hypothetical protein
MTESEKLIYDLLHEILSAIPPASSLLGEDITRGEMTEILRLNDTEIFEAFQDFSVAFDSLNFIAADYQLRLKAADIWKQQLEVFRSGLKTRAEDLIAACKNKGIDIEKSINEILNY